MYGPKRLWGARNALFFDLPDPNVAFAVQQHYDCTYTGFVFFLFKLIQCFKTSSVCFLTPLILEGMRV